MEHQNPASRIGPEAQLGPQEANMRNFLFAVAIAAVAAPAAYAQDQHHNADRQDRTSLYGQNAQSEHRTDRDTHSLTVQDEHRNGRAGVRDRGDEQRGNAGDDRHFNYRGHEFAAVRAQEYRYPRGWHYREWSVGQTLPNLFLGQPYSFEYQTIGLPPPPRGERWVRFGPDALLVNLRTRRIVDVIHNVFYT
jgi:Ni/Co efflux regulator RcnB